MTTMRSRIRYVALAAAVALASTGDVLMTETVRAQAQSTATAPPAGNATTGQKTFMKVGCQRCHGGVGQGGQSAGPRIAPNPLPFAAFSRYIRAPRASMPPYTEKVLSEQDLADIHAFLRAQPGPAKVDGLLPPSP